MNTESLGANKIASLSLFMKLIMLGFVAYGLILYFPVSSKSINNIFYLVVAVPGFVWAIRDRARLYKAMRRYVWFLLPLFMLVLAVSHELKDMKVFLYLVLFWLFLLMLEERHILGVRLPMFGVSGVNVVLLLTAILSWAAAGLSTGVWSRNYSLLGYAINPVYTATLMMMSMVFLWVFFLDEYLQARGKWIHVGGFLALLLLGVVCATVFQARSALVGFALFVFLYVVFKRAYVLIFGAVMAGIGLFLVDSFREAVLARGLSYRPQIWEDAMVRVVDVCGLWLGCGDDGYEFLGQWSHAHSAYVSIFYEAGLIGAALFLLFLGMVFFLAMRVRSKWLLVAMVGWGSLITTTGGVFSTPHQAFWLYFWFPTLMAAIEVQQSHAVGTAREGAHQVESAEA